MNQYVVEPVEAEMYLEMCDSTESDPFTNSLYVLINTMNGKYLCTMSHLGPSIVIFKGMDLVEHFMKHEVDDRMRAEMTPVLLRSCVEETDEELMTLSTEVGTFEAKGGVSIEDPQGGTMHVSGKAPGGVAKVLAALMDSLGLEDDITSPNPQVPPVGLFGNRIDKGDA